MKTRWIARITGILLLGCLYAGVADAAPPRRHHAKHTTNAPVSDYREISGWRGDGSGSDEMGQNTGNPTDGVHYVPAMNGRGFRFTQSDDAVIVADSPSLALTHSFTINVWVNVDVFTTADENKGMILFRGDDRPGLDPYTLHVDESQRLCLHVESENARTEISAPMPGHRFVMVTALLNDATGAMELYENGVLVSRTTTAVRPFATLDSGQYPAVGIGNCNALPGSRCRYPFHGVINDLRIWQRVLAPGEIRLLYAGSTSVSSPLVPK